MHYLLAPVQAPDEAFHACANWDRAEPLTPVTLTAVQQRIYDYVRRYQQMWDGTPLYREIARECGLRSQSAVHYQINQLVKHGLITKPPHRRRAIRLRAVLVKKT